MSAGDHVLRGAKSEREHDRMLNAIEKADLEELLRQPWGRRFYYRLIYEIGNLNSSSFHPEVKDGVCAAMHMSRDEGVRWFASVLAKEAQLSFPDLWIKMQAERIFAAAEEAKLRAQARDRDASKDDQ